MAAAMTRQEAEMLAIEGLQYIAGSEADLPRFLALSGLSPQDLRDVSGSPAFLSGVLDYFMGDEATLLAFASAQGRDPAEISMARAVLSRSSEAGEAGK